MIQRLVRPEVAKLVPYQPNPNQGQERERILLDANESPYPLTDEIRQEMLQRLAKMDLHRYPDPDCQSLKRKIATYLEGRVSPAQILVGNGSDELLNQVIQTFIGPGEGVLALSPTFSMYQIFTQQAGGVYYSCPLKPDGTFDLDAFWEKVQEVEPKLIFLCSPNNPTGTLIPPGQVVELAQNFSGIVVVDEAYGEFSDAETLIAMVNQLPNLVVTRTFSKAFGLAAVRLGYLVANLPVIREISKVGLPYHLNGISQMMGEVILDHLPQLQTDIRTIQAERRRVREAVEQMIAVERTEQKSDWRLLPSEANFLYIKGTGVARLTTALSKAGIRVRRFESRNDDMLTAIRITIGTPAENDQVIQVIGQLQGRGREDAQAKSQC